MSKIMESKQSAPSVIARLMGFGELHPQQPVQKRQRVLSENYLRRVASIGVRERHSFHARNSFRLGCDEQKKCKDVFGVSETLKNEKHHLLPVSKRKLKSDSSEVNRTLMRQKSRFEKCVTADKKLQLSIKDCEAYEVIDSEMDFSPKYFKDPDVLIMKPLNDWQFIPSPSQSGHIPISNSSPFSDFRETKVHRRFWRMGRRGYVESNEKIKNGLSTGSYGELGIVNVSKFPRSSFDFANRRCIPTTRVAVLKSYPESPQNSASQFSSSTTTHGFQLGDRKHTDILNPGSGNLFIEEGRKNIADDRKSRRPRSSFSNESNRQMEHGLSIMSARVPELETGSSATTHEVDHTVQGNLVTEELEVTLEDKDQSEQNCVVSRSSLHDVASISVVLNILSDPETEAVGKSFVIVEKHYGSTEHILEKDDSSSSYSPEKSIQQDMPSGVSEEGSVSSCCSGTEFESPMSLEDAYQPSPVSVLEPICENDISSCSESFQNGGVDLQGLQLQLEILKSAVSDAYSEGSGMIVSSDEDSGEVVSIGYSEEYEDSFKEESKEFSYLVDVFSEAGFWSRNPFVGSDKCHSQECLIDPSVFETVEKKYGVQKSWKRSERRLLFDHINSGLMEILHSCTGVFSRTKRVGRRLSFRHSHETIMEELWSLLVSQEKQAFKESEKVLGNDDGWLDLGDEVEVIGIEIENSLIDELAAELVSIENL
ncbi:hypothetical protein HS088_TW21G01735 [Tripterygium wilfordii]|uniref:DUF4378 domain-containing protein n=1 Tax=Tripterygium wilfordii TaxID=458696 RepID=A0A7J7C625_TRIWF|nr:uncharacterized protein LOC119989505 [Tripterygium wilfordii]XP_038691014.1 uncharacterized protein LOC119989505 [Tripterygium wilfordii]KAF5729568.1 hypothetical protein HS088_TW21G01735 [Tripterygium wilfordii]